MMRLAVNFLFAFICLLPAKNLLAGPGDTLTVQTFTFGSLQDVWFTFPSDTIRFEKILMKYTLKCNPAQNPACGEWDYLTNTYVYQHTGLQDSTLIIQPTHLVGGLRPDSVHYMKTPSYTYKAHWQYYPVHTTTISLNTYSLDSGTQSSVQPFGAQAPVSRCQYVWRAQEMSAAGMSAGNITGLQLFVQSAGSKLRNLTVRMKATTQDSLTLGNLDLYGFTTVLTQNRLLGLGWNSLQLVTPFNWNGTSNILVEITYDNLFAGSNSLLAASSQTYHAGLVNAGSDRSHFAHTTGHVDVPVNTQLAALDSFVTIAYWAYGSVAFHPQDGTCFEARDSSDNRILNVHGPWSDGNVYWDAGYGGTANDRINKVITGTQVKGQWNHWAYTKNVGTGSMKIYLNGVLFHSANGKPKRMRRMKNFRIGNGLWNGAQPYEGQLDEFAVFNKELSPSAIQTCMNRGLDATHPNYTNLVLYYKFNDGNYSTYTDAAPVTHAPGLFLAGQNPVKASSDLVSGFAQTVLRPNLVFEQGVYTTHKDSVLVIDSTQNAAVQILVFTDSLNRPGTCIDTIVGWPAYYNHYTYDAQGHVLDSVWVQPDSVLYTKTYKWYRKFPQVLRYEMARYITPYGNGLSLGNGWTWTFDVSDYRTLLANQVHLAAGNWQELLDVKFLMIRGTPPRDIKSIQNLWNGNFNYGQPSDPIESHLTPKTVSLPATALNMRWKSRITGHGMDTPDNCAEFCPRDHYFKVNGTQQFSRLVWRDNCDLNPLYPQGGTWAYDRSNWCPGAEVWTYDLELTPHVTPGSQVTLDHDVQPYTNGGEWSYYQIEDQLVTYGAPNFSMDAAVEDIIAPSTNDMWRRFNTICTHPIIRIKNTGSATLTSLDITYGLTGGTPSTYHWTGSLPFLGSAEVTLGDLIWTPNPTEFYARLSNPNGGTDQYAYNNRMASVYQAPLVLPSKFIIEFKSNSAPTQNQYTLKNSAGTVIKSRSNLTANTMYSDTVNLPDGCYEFELTDSGEDGLSWWANSAQGSGSLRFRKYDSPAGLKNFNADFGGKIYQQFAVGLVVGIEDYSKNDGSSIRVYPNPATQSVFIQVNLDRSRDGKIQLLDLLGKIVYESEFKHNAAENVEVDVSQLRKGMYFVNVTVEGAVLTEKVIVH